MRASRAARHVKVHVEGLEGELLLQDGGRQRATSSRQKDVGVQDQSLEGQALFARCRAGVKPEGTAVKPKVKLGDTVFWKSLTRAEQSGWLEWFAAMRRRIIQQADSVAVSFQY